jgi:hypothetical protein
MAQQAKKMSNFQKHSPLGLAEAAQETQEKVVKMELDSIEAIVQTADTCNRMAGELADVCSGNLSACVESGSTATHFFHEVSNEVMETVNRAFSDYARFTREAFTCHTIADVLKLQSNLVQRRLESYLDEGSKFCDILFQGCEQMLEPLNERTAIASDQFRKAFAA